MKKTNFMFSWAVLGASALFLTGCVSAPGTYPIVAGVDDIPVAEKTMKMIERVKSEKKYKIAVVPERAAYTNRFVVKYGMNKLIGDQIESLCSELSMFEVAARRELDILSAEDMVSNLTTAGDKINLPKAVDGLLVYSINSCSIDSRMFSEYRTVKYGNQYRQVEKKIKKYGGFITLKITLINRSNHEKLFTKLVSGKSEWDDAGEHGKLLSDATNVALNDFIAKFAYDFAPVGFVTQTTGGGRWAKISLGTNSGLRFHSRVEFLRKGMDGQWMPYAYGEVREPNYDYSWVLVDDFSDVPVRNNSAVKVSANQSRSFGAKFSDAFSMVYGSEGR